jgi:WD40 repeat protein/Flp pilus assembly protein TadD
LTLPQGTTRIECTMDTQELKQLVRTYYPFPIAYTHKKMLGVLDDNVEKLKCLVETAEAAIQFLALLALAQVRQDLLNPPQNHLEREEHPPTPPSRGDYPPITPLRRGIVPHVSPLADPPPTPPRRGIDLSRLREEIKLANPTFGKWNRMAREAMKAYCDARDYLIVPELFDFFWFWDTSRQKLRSQRLDNTIISPLIILRNDFHHGRVPDGKVQERVAEGLHWLHQLLEAIQFLAQYQLSFTQRITLKKAYYIHDLMLFSGCVSDRYRWESEMALEPDSVVFLHSKEGRHLVLNPFIIVTDRINGVPDLMLLNNVVKNKAIYVSSQFGEVLETTEKDWAEGRRHHEALSEFFEHLQLLKPEEEAGEKFPSWEEPGVDKSPLEGGRGVSFPLSTAEVFQQKYQQPTPPVQHINPYKFLDYYNPEDHDIFFGRDKEIRLLQQRFYNSRLLVLHGESGTGKTSLIRAGLIPHLDPESYVPVYVRMLQDPLKEIKRELTRQLGVEDVHPGCPQVTGCDSPLEGGQGGVRHSAALRDLLQTITEHVSKTVVIVLDQFEEFFLRFPEEIREQFKKEFAACVEMPRLDVKFLISLRADYFSYLAQFEDAIPQIFTHQLQLEHLTESQALKAVVKPAERLGIQVDEAMVQIKLLPELVSEEEGIEPPLLQIVCDALYQNAQSKGRQEIGMADYEAIGDVKGCLGRYLDTKLRQFGEKQPIARAVLKALVTTEGTKRASFVEELLSRMRSISSSPPLVGGVRGGGELTEDTLKQNYLDKFVRDRLVRVEEIEGKARYELTHEYLVKHIEAWIEESEREVTKVLELIDRAYETYQATGMLLERSALQMIKPHEEQLVLPSEKQTFVERSKTQVRKQRRGLMVKVGIALLVVALVVGGILGYQTYQQYQETIRQRDIAITERQKAEEQRKRAENQTEIAQENLKQSQINEIEALIQTSKALFTVHDELGALVTAVKAGKNLKQTDGAVAWKNQVILHLREVVDGVHEKNRLKAHKGYVASIAFSRNGTLIASGGMDGTIKFWKTADGNKIRTIQQGGIVNSVAFHPDDTLLASGGVSSIVLWKVADGSKITELDWDETVCGPIVRSVSFSPDGRLLASGREDGSVILCDSVDGKSIILSGHTDVVESVAFSPDGTLLASGSRDKTIKLWKVANGSEIRTLYGHADQVRSVAFSPDGMLLASGSFDKTIKLWKVSNGSEIRTLLGHTDQVESVDFSPNGMLFASASTGDTLSNSIIKLWRVTDGREILTLYGDSGNVTFSPDSTLLVSGGWDQTITLWKIDARETIPLSQHFRFIYAIDFSVNGTLLVLGGDQSGKLLKIAEGNEVKTLSTTADGIDSSRSDEVVDFSPDGTLLAVGTKDGIIKLWEVADGSEIRTFAGHSGQIKSVAFSPDGTLLASGSADKTVKLWKVSDSSEIKTLSGHNDEISSIAFSLDGTMLASGSHDGTIKLWEVTEGSEINTLCEHSRLISLIKFSPDGRLLASVSNPGGVLSSSDTTIKLWNVAEGREIRTLIGFSDIVQSIDFSPDGTLLVSGSSGGATGANAIQLWNIAEGREIRTLVGFSDIIQSISFSPDGSLLVSGQVNGSISLWNLNLDDLLVRGCDWIFDYLKNGSDISESDRGLCDDVTLMKAGSYYHHQGKLEEATAAFQKQIKIEPEHNDAWNSMGKVFYEQGKLDEAIAAFQKQVEIDPGHEEAWYNIGRSLQSQDKIDEAVAAFQKQVEVFQKQVEVLSLSEPYKPYKSDKAIAACQKLLELKPDHKDAWSIMGRSLQMQGKLDEALAAYRKQIEIEPDYERSWYNIGIILGQQGKLDEAVGTYQKLVELKPEYMVSFWFDIGNILFSQGKWAEALAAYQKQVEVTPDHAWAWGAMGYALQIQNKLDEALVAYRKQVEIKPEHEWAWYDTGVVLYNQGNLNAALTAFKKQVEVTPDHEWAWQHLGSVLWTQGKLDEAATAFANGLSWNPNNISLLSYDAGLALIQGDIPRCQAQIAKARPQANSYVQESAILPFFAWLADSEYDWEYVMTAINELDPRVKFTWDLSNMTPAIERQDEETQQIAKLFIAFFEDNIGLETLKTRLAEKE